MSRNVQIMKREDAIRISKEKAHLLPLVEIHMLHTVAGALLNRDFNNRQKVLHYGGTLRGRFTSQSVLHDIRLGMETEQDVHTKYLPEMVKNAVKEKAAEEDEVLKTGLKLVNQVFSPDKKNKKKKDADVETANDTTNDGTSNATNDAANDAKVLKTEQIIDVDRFTVDTYAETIIEMAKKINAGSEKLKDAVTDVMKAMTTSSKDRPLSDVTALFARMSSDQTYSTVNSPLMVSHAFTIDPYANDYDDFTAVDDYILKSGIVVTDDDGCEINSGAAHMGSTDISANTYYRYCSICQTILLENLCVGKPFDAVDELIEKTYKLTAYFVKQFISSLPSAKQTRNFARTMPDAVYIDTGIFMQPLAAADAFEKAVVPVAGKSICDIGVERLQKFMDDSVHGCFVDRELMGRYWMSNRYDAPKDVPTIKFKDIDTIVRP